MNNPVPLNTEIAQAASDGFVNELKRQRNEAQDDLAQCKGTIASLNVALDAARDNLVQLNAANAKLLEQLAAAKALVANMEAASKPAAAASGGKRVRSQKSTPSA